MKLTETELLEVADTFGISHPAIVEKDYYSSSDKSFGFKRSIDVQIEAFGN